MRGVPKRAAFAVLAVLGFSAVASATPYWIAWEGNDFPENQGWTRVHGPNGAQTQRTLQNGVMALDGFQHPGGEYDGSVMYPFQGIHLDAGEQFVAEWRLLVGLIDDPVYQWDPTISFNSDDGRMVAFIFGSDRFRSGFEVSEPATVFGAGQWHCFRLVSADLGAYSLFMDGALVRAGVWTQTLAGARVSWGDGVGAVSSESAWDFVRFGVVPEPSSALTLAACALGAIRRIRM